MYRHDDIRVRYIHEYTTVRLLSVQLHFCFTKGVATRLPVLIVPVL